MNVITVRLEPLTERTLARVARAQGVSVSEYLRAALALAFAAPAAELATYLDVEHRGPRKHT